MPRSLGRQRLRDGTPRGLGGGWGRGGRMARRRGRSLGCTRAPRRLGRQRLRDGTRQRLGGRGGLGGRTTRGLCGSRGGTRSVRGLGRPCRTARTLRELGRRRGYTRPVRTLGRPPGSTRTVRGLGVRCRYARMGRPRLLCRPLRCGGLRACRAVGGGWGVREAGGGPRWGRWSGGGGVLGGRAAQVGEVGLGADGGGCAASVRCAVRRRDGGVRPGDPALRRHVGHRGAARGRNRTCPPRHRPAVTPYRHLRRTPCHRLTGTIPSRCRRLTGTTPSRCRRRAVRRRLCRRTVHRLLRG